MRITLRPYQEDALARVLDAADRGVRRQLGVAATGLGKTVIFSSLAERIGGRTLILAHRDELVTQAAEKVREVWAGVDVGIVKAERDEVDATVVVASIQTLARERRLDRLLMATAGGSMFGSAGPFDLVVVDEAHHAAADSYRRVLAALRAGAPAEQVGTDVLPPGPLLLGVTATPDRGDGQGLDGDFDEITFTYDLQWGIRSGFLSDVRGLRVSIDGLDLSNVRMSRGDYQAGDAGRALEAADAPAAIVRAWQDHAVGRRTLVFTPTVAVAEAVADEFQLCGVPAAWVSGETPMEDRRAILSAYAAGRIQVLANCAVLTEGYDEPRTDCIVVARPTKSRALYAQMVGRGTRRHPDKTDCLVLDVVGATDDLSLVTIPSLFGVEDGEIRKRLQDGTALAVGAVAEWEAEQVRLGRIRAEEVELFAAVRAGEIAWVKVHRDGQARRYERSLGDDRGTVVLVQRGDADDGWVAGWVSSRGEKRVLINGVSMELAQGVGEDYVRKHGRPALTSSSAPWRAKAATPKQRGLARRLGITVTKGMTAGELSDAIDAQRAARR